MSEELVEFVGILRSGINEGGGILPGGGGARGGGGSENIGGLVLSTRRVVAVDGTLERVAPWPLIEASSMTEDTAESIDRRSCEDLVVLRMVANPVAVSLKTLVDGEGVGPALEPDAEARAGVAEAEAGGMNWNCCLVEEPTRYSTGELGNGATGGGEGIDTGGIGADAGGTHSSVWMDISLTSGLGSTVGSTLGSSTKKSAPTLLVS